MKHILFLDQYSTIGGGQTVLLAMIESCLDSGWSVSVLAPGSGDLEAKLDRLFGSEIVFIPLYEMKMKAGKKSLVDVFELVKGSVAVWRHYSTIKKQDIVHVNGPRLFPAAGLLARIMRPKFFFHIHLDHKGVDLRIIRWILSANSCAGLIANSKFVYEKLRSNLRSHHNKLTLIRYGLSKAFSQMPYVARFMEPTLLRPVIIGRISPEKGQATVVQVARNLRAIEFDVIGGSDFQEARYATNLKSSAPPNVNFLGKSQDIARTIDERGSNASIVPSAWEEPFGLVSVESMCLSLLTINSKKGGLIEIAEETGAATFANPSELEQLISQYASMSPNELNELTKRLFANVRAHFGWEQFDRAFQLRLKS